MFGQPSWYINFNNCIFLYNNQKSDYYEMLHLVVRCKLQRSLIYYYRIYVGLRVLLHRILLL